MKSELFGTDGIRGTANSEPMTAEMALRLGIAAGRYFRRDGSAAHRVVIGKDTRLSGYMFENALTAGFTSAGMNVLLLGPLPTPALGMLTTSLRADAGVMISASHNPHQDNGIKFFGPDGFKLSDDDEVAIEAILASGEAKLARPERIGRAKRIDDGPARYAERVKASFDPGLTLDGLRIVIDCANGAAYKAAPEILWELGAEVIRIGTSPDGLNINMGCGSTNISAAAAKVIETRADIGICLDGDADRVILLDEKGRAADGDQIMALLAGRFQEAGKLNGGKLVATIMSNLGLERHLGSKGIGLSRTKVGDRYVVEEMRRGGYTLGGEQSGHIVMLEHATTGDGLLAALQALAALVQTGKRASELLNVFEPVPQMLENIRYVSGTAPLEATEVKKAIREAEAALSGEGRLVIRKSGTEPLIRVMAEAEDEGRMKKIVSELSALIAKAS